MKKILIVEDEAALVTLLKYNLEKQGYATAAVMDGREVVTAALQEKPDLILLDWMLPNVAGIDICRQIRKTFNLHHIPIIMLTARGDEADKVKGLTFGADDYMTKPFSVPELLARIAALLRRAQPAPISQDIKTFADMTIDFAKHRVTRSGQDMHLGPTEFRILQFLMETPGDVLSREDLLKRVWGGSIYVEPRTVDVHIRRLRTALNAGGRADLIRTIRSAGYAMDMEATQDDSQID